MVLECEVNGAATLLSRARPHPAGHHLTKAQKPLHRTWSTWRTARFIVMLPCLMQTKEYNRVSHHDPRLAFSMTSHGRRLQCFLYTYGYAK